MSEPAEREVKETSVTWRDCCLRMCLPAASSNAAAGLEQAVRSASCPVNQLRFAVRGQLQRHGSLPMGGRMPLLDSRVDCVVTTWFCSPRLETRTKESNMCVSSWVAKPICTVKMLAGNFAPATDHSIVRSLNMNMLVRTRKMVNYAGEGQTQGKL